MKKRTLLGMATVAMTCALAAPGDADAQIPWESTMLLSPSSPAGVSAHLIRFDYSVENSLGALITYRPVTGAGGVGYRLAIAEGNVVRSMAVAGGMDFSGLLLSNEADFPVDVMWFAGLGAGVSDYMTLAAPFGLAFGRPVVGRAGWFNPYVSARGVLETAFGDGAPPGSDATLGVAVDVGADLALGSSQSVVLRLGASLGDRQTLVIGLNLGSR